MSMAGGRTAVVSVRALRGGEERLVDKVIDVVCAERGTSHETPD
jgi:hypothetical protein